MSQRMMNMIRDLEQRADAAEEKAREQSTVIAHLMDHCVSLEESLTKLEHRKKPGPKPKIDVKGSKGLTGGLQGVSGVPLPDSGSGTASESVVEGANAA